MAFAAIHFPNFPVQAVIRAEPPLRGAPVALVDGAPPVWNVVATNETAACMGIQIGMTRTHAEQFEGLQIRLRSLAQEIAAHAALLDLAWSISPRVEDTAADVLVIDAAGLASLFGSDENIANLLMQQVVAFGFTAHVAIASNPEAATHAARGLRGITLIAPGEESKRLGALPVSVLGASVEILETLELWGVRTCEALAALPVLQVSERLGQQGVQLHEWARGARARAMVLAEPRITFEEEMELEDSVEELEPLSFLLGRLLDRLYMRLTARSLAANAVHVQFALDPVGRKDVQIRNDDSRRKKKSSMYEKALTLPVPMRDSKMLLNLLRLQLQGDPPSAPILKIVISAEAAKPRAVQTGLFVPPSPDIAKLELTIARLTNFVGDGNIGSPQLVNTHRPGEFRMNLFAPSREGEKSLRKAAVAANALALAKTPATRAHDFADSKPAIGFRMFRPPLPASVQLYADRPKRVSFRGAHGEVLAASGPWRSSGDWWREDEWHQDEWDLEIRFHIPPGRQAKSPASCPQHGLYRLYFDSIVQGWFVRGIYD